MTYAAKIEWNEQFKVRLSQAIKSRDHHDIVKLMLVRKLVRNHSKDSSWIKIYTEFEVLNGVIADVYYENAKTKEAYAFEIQKDMSNNIINEKKDKYKNWEQEYFTTDLIIIDLNKISKNIDEMDVQLDEYIV